MVDIPGYCPHCGAIFAIGGFIGSPNGNAKFALKNIGTNCPECGQSAQLVDGSFNEKDGALELVSGPPITQEILSQLDQLVKDAESGKISRQELAIKAAELHEGMGAAIALLVTRYPKTLLIVITLISLLKACNPEIKLDLNQLLEQVVQITQKDEDSPPALSGERQDIEQKLPSSNTKHKITGKQDRIGHQKSPSTRRRDVNRKKRQELKRSRMLFPRKSR